ncbi:hypothetical protein FRC09_004201, partial [Ceratobasidium sp. 395]
MEHTQYFYPNVSSAGGLLESVPGSPLALAPGSPLANAFTNHGFFPNAQINTGGSDQAESDEPKLGMGLSLTRSLAGMHFESDEEDLLPTTSHNNLTAGFAVDAEFNSTRSGEGSHDNPYWRNSLLDEAIEEPDEVDLQLLSAGAAADVLVTDGSNFTEIRCNALVVKKVLRVSRSHFNHRASERGEDTLLEYCESFCKRIMAWSQLVHPNIARVWPSLLLLSFYQERCEQGDLRN